MYTFATEWPERANKAAYQAYAKLPSWHIEEAASLVAGFIPRSPLYLNLRPILEEPNKTKPYEAAQPWPALLDSQTGAVGQVMSLFGRARAVHPQTSGRSDAHVSPGEFLEFCERYAVPVPEELRQAVYPGPRSMTASVRETERAAESETPKQPETRYKTHALEVARELREAGCRNVPAPMFKVLIESRFAPEERTITHRAFQEYLDKWRQADAEDRDLRALLSAVLVESSGRPRKVYMEDLRRRLPERYKRVPLTEKPTD